MKLWKILTPLALCLVLALMILPGKAEAATVQSGTCGDNLTWTLDDAGTLTVSGTGPMTDYYDYETVPWAEHSTSVKKAIIEDGVTTIGEAAFWYCNNLSDVILGNSVATIGDEAFRHCLNLAGIWVNENNPNYSSDDRGVLFDKNKAVLIQAPRRISGIYTVPTSVIAIGEDAFNGCSRLAGVVLSNGVTAIGKDAFANCPNLTYNVYDNAKYLGCEENPYHALIAANANSVEQCELHQNTTVIASFAFANCSALTDITIGDSVTAIGDHAFFNCKSLTEVTIGNGVTIIGTWAFYGCESMTTVTIGNGITTIEDVAFSGCKALSDVYYEGTKAEWETVEIGTSNNPLRNARFHFKEG